MTLALVLFIIPTKLAFQYAARLLTESEFHNDDGYRHKWQCRDAYGDILLP